MKLFGDYRARLCFVGLMTTVLMVGCGHRSQLRPSRTIVRGQAPETNRPAEFANVPTVPTSQLKPSERQLEALFDAHDRLQQDVNILVLRLQRHLQPEDASHVTTLQRLYSTGRLLKELQAWGVESGSLSDRDRIEELLQRRRQWESLMISVARQPQAGSPR